MLHGPWEASENYLSISCSIHFIGPPVFGDQRASRDDSSAACFSMIIASSSTYYTILSSKHTICENGTPERGESIFATLLELPIVRPCGQVIVLLVIVLLVIVLLVIVLLVIVPLI